MSVILVIINMTITFLALSCSTIITSLANRTVINVQATPRSTHW